MDFTVNQRERTFDLISKGIVSESLEMGWLDRSYPDGQVLDAWVENRMAMHFAVSQGQRELDVRAR